MTRRNELQICQLILFFILLLIIKEQHVQGLVETNNIDIASISNVVLVNTETGLDVLSFQRNDNNTTQPIIIDTTIIGTKSLSIRVDVIITINDTTNSSASTTTSSNKYILFDLDNGISKRIESTPPYMLGGKQLIINTIATTSNNSTNDSTKLYEYFPSYRLRIEGKHTILIHIVDTMDIDMIQNSINNNNNNNIGTGTSSLNQYVSNSNTTWYSTFYIQHGQHQESNITTTNGTITDIDDDNDDDIFGDSIPEDNENSNTTTTSTTDTDVLPIQSNRFGQWNDHTITISYPNSSTSKSIATILTTTKIIAFTGPIASERSMTEPGCIEYRNPSPFADYRCDIIITILINSSNSTTTPTTLSSSTTIIYPCYYSGTGNAANTGDIGGYVWQCPIRILSMKDNYNNSINNYSTIETYQWTVSFVEGTNIATTTYISGNNGNPGQFFHQQNGTFTVTSSDNADIVHNNNQNHERHDITTKLNSYYIGIHTMDLFHYIDFDGTSINNIETIKTYAKYNTYNDTTKNTTTIHLENRPTWNDGHGRGILGALTKLQQSTSKHTFNNLNIISTLSLNDSIYPFVDLYDNLSYDISKLAQWEIVFTYAADIGMSIVLDLNENTILDIEERYLYIREMIARFGQYCIAYVIDSYESAAYIRSLNGIITNNTTIPTTLPHPAAIIWRVNIDTKIVSLSQQTMIDGILIVLNNPTMNIVYDLTRNWKLANPQLIILVCAMITTTADDIQTNTTALNISSSSSTNGTDNTTYSDILISNLFAGGAGALVQPSFMNTIETENGILDWIENDSSYLNDPTIDNIQRIWERLLWPSTIVSVPTTCNEKILVGSVTNNNVWCLSDDTYGRIIIYIPVNVFIPELHIVLQNSIDSQSLYNITWIHPKSTGNEEIGAATPIVLGNNNTMIDSPPTSNTSDWILLLSCIINCESGS